MLTDKQIFARVASLKDRTRDRDSRQQDVLLVRQGKIATVYPDFFPEGIEANVVANFVDIVARDLSEVMAPLPAVNCSVVSQVKDRARKAADNRTRIAANYFYNSDLQVQMYTGADWYVTFGFVPFIIELDTEAKLPRIRVESPVGAYPEFDRYGRWRWRLDVPMPAANLRRKDGDDAPLKVCAMFDLPLSAIPFVERSLLRLARSVSGEYLPGATLCYVWDHTLPTGTELANAYTRRVRFVVLDSGSQRLGQWVAHQQDLHADFLRLFGAESDTVPPLLAIVVGADSDNTGSTSLGYLGDLSLLKQ